MPRSTPTAARILDCALDLAETCGWEGVHLHSIANALDCDIAAIARHYPQKDELIEAWFARADQHLLARARQPDLLALSAEKRLEELLIAWLEALDGHRQVTRQMLLSKLQPGQLQLQLGGLQRIGRTVQWWREAAQRKPLHLARLSEESLLTAVYLRTFAHWLRHADADPVELRALLRRQLRCGPLGFLLRERAVATPG